MKTVQKSSIFSSLFLAVIFLSGCCLQQNIQIEDPMEITSCSGKDGRVVTIPRAQNDPAVKLPVIGKKVLQKKYIPMSPAKVSAAEAEKTATAQPVKPPETEKLPEKLTKKEKNAETVRGIVKTVPPATQNPPKQMPEHFRKGPGMWRAFSKMSPAEQQELLKLQRTAPERFREVMQEKVNQLYEQEKMRQQELEKLTVQYRSSKDEKEKSAIKNELHKKIKENFEQRLHDTRRDIEAHKRRTAHMEAELIKREKNCDAIINALVEHRLNGSTPATAAQITKTDKKNEK